MVRYPVSPHISPNRRARGRSRCENPVALSLPASASWHPTASARTPSGMLSSQGSPCAPYYLFRSKPPYLSRGGRGRRLRPSDFITSRRAKAMGRFSVGCSGARLASATLTFQSCRKCPGGRAYASNICGRAGSPLGVRTSPVVGPSHQALDSFGVSAARSSQLCRN
jgi:hypothetical protein